MSLIVFALQRLSCPSMDSRFDSMHVQARTPVTRHAMLVHSMISLLGPVAHACHSHECSSRFFVMHVHRTYTSIRGTHKHQSLLHVCIVPCSSVLVVLRFLVQHPLFGTDVIAFSYRCFYLTTNCLSFPTHIRNSRLSCRHISSSCCLLLLCGLRTFAALPGLYHGLDLKVTSTSVRGLNNFKTKLGNKQRDRRNHRSGRSFGLTIPHVSEFVMSTWSRLQ